MRYKIVKARDDTLRVMHWNPPLRVFKWEIFKGWWEVETKTIEDFHGSDIYEYQEELVFCTIDKAQEYISMQQALSDRNRLPKYRNIMI